MTRKRLNKDDLSLWQKVTERTEKLDMNQLFRPEIDAPAPSAPQIRKTTSVILGKPKPKPRRSTHDLMPSLPDQIRKAPVQMDSKAFTRLKRGKLSPEGRIDLHGMTLDRAHPALTRFILNAHKNGKRLVLVITTKAKCATKAGQSPCGTGSCAIRCRNGCRWHRWPVLCCRSVRPISATAAAALITSICGVTAEIGLACLGISGCQSSPWQRRSHNRSQSGSSVQGNSRPNQ